MYSIFYNRAVNETEIIAPFPFHKTFDLLKKFDSLNI